MCRCEPALGCTGKESQEGLLDTFVHSQPDRLTAGTPVGRGGLQTGFTSSWKLAHRSLSVHPVDPLNGFLFHVAASQSSTVTSFLCGLPINLYHCECIEQGEQVETYQEEKGRASGNHVKQGITSPPLPQCVTPGPESCIVS